MSAFRLAERRNDSSSHVRREQRPSRQHQQPGQVAGVAENNEPDPTCVATRQVLHFRPVLWEEGEIQELPTIAGDTDGFANAINDEGQAVGQTGNCTKTFHGVLWQNGTVTDLGTLEGLLLGPVDINNRGQIVGSAFSPDFTTLLAFCGRTAWRQTLALCRQTFLAWR